jgi:hypothetical protein
VRAALAKVSREKGATRLRYSFGAASPPSSNFGAARGGEDPMGNEITKRTQFFRKKANESA